MPLDDSFELPRYSAEAEYLSPEHCRICFTYGPQGLEQHLQESHGCTHAQYRRLINRRVLKEWPRRPEPQVLRTRMAAFKTQLCDANFEEKPCASCCRLKRRCKLFDVNFPASDAELPPAWLPWSAAEWLEHRQSWYDSVDRIFNIENYLSDFFCADKRLLGAKKELLACQEERIISPVFQSVQAAESWVRRVETWIQNLRRDLERDSLPAPGQCGAW